MPQLWAIWRWLRAHWPFSRSTSLILRMDNLFLGIVSSMARSPWGVLRQGVGLSRAAWLSGLSNTSFRGVGTCSNRSGIGVQFPSESVFTLLRNRCSVSRGIGTSGPGVVCLLDDAPNRLL